MIKVLKSLYTPIRPTIKRFRHFMTVNWVKTIYFNLKMLPFAQAKKLPFYFYGNVKFTNLSGSVTIEAPLTTGMFGFGLQYEKTTRSKKIAELIIKGHLIIRGYVQFGKDCFVFVKENATLDLGNMSGMASDGKIICTKAITLQTYARIGSECQVIDTDFHQMIDTVTKEKYEISKPIIIGAYNYVSRWSSIMKNTVTPDYCTIASNSLCNKDYTNLGTHILIGGIPAKLLKTNISRDWEGEHKMMEQNLILQNRIKPI